MKQIGQDSRKTRSAENDTFFTDDAGFAEKTMAVISWIRLKTRAATKTFDWILMNSPLCQSVVCKEGPARTTFLNHCTCKARYTQGKSLLRTITAAEK